MLGLWRTVIKQCSITVKAIKQRKKKVFVLYAVITDQEIGDILTKENVYEVIEIVIIK